MTIRAPLHLMAVVGLLLSSLASVNALAAEKTGTFRSIGSETVRGTVKVSSSGKITLSGFSTSSGPDLYVYVGKGSPSRQVAKLRRRSGTQTYSIPASVAKSITTVHIHCKKFSHLYGTARVR